MSDKIIDVNMVEGFNFNRIKLCRPIPLHGQTLFSKLSNKAFKNIADLKSFIKKNPIKNKTILLKGSRGISLEELVDSL